MSRIEVFACGGDDFVKIWHNLHAPAIIDGGGGRDLLFGGAGNDILLGGAGDDHLHGNEGTDVLVGGTGDDDLNGGSGDDLLIGGADVDALAGGQEDDALVAGSTPFDADAAALGLLLAEWASGAPYGTRVENLRDGTGPFLSRTGVRLAAGETVFDDAPRFAVGTARPGLVPRGRRRPQRGRRQGQRQEVRRDHRQYLASSRS